MFTRFVAAMDGGLANGVSLIGRMNARRIMNRIYHLTDVELALLWVVGSFVWVYVALWLIQLGVM